MCVCVCVCERELGRERERDTDQNTHTHTSHTQLYISTRRGSMILNSPSFLSPFSLSACTTVFHLTYIFLLSLRFSKVCFLFKNKQCTIHSHTYRARTRIRVRRWWLLQLAIDSYSVSYLELTKSDQNVFEQKNGAARRRFCSQRKS